MGGMGQARTAIFITAFALFGCSSQIVPAATPTSKAVLLRFGATGAMQPLVNDIAQGYLAERPSISLDTRQITYDQTPPQDSEENATYYLSSHLPADGPQWAAPIGQDAIAVITHPGVGVDSLTTAQLRDIYQGQVANWAQVGGQNVPVQVISREASADTRAEFERFVMGNRQTTRAALVAPSARAMIETVATTPGAVGYASLGYLGTDAEPLALDGVTPTRETVQDSTYPLRSTLFVVGTQEPEGAYRALIAWMQSREGQAVISQRYVPLLPP